jgi:hypothetical protein
MDAPLVSEDSNLDRLLETIKTEHGDEATILYQDSVRRGGVLGFFAREVHRVAYQVGSTGPMFGELDPAGTDTGMDMDTYTGMDTYTPSDSAADNGSVAGAERPEVEAPRAVAGGQATGTAAAELLARYGHPVGDGRSARHRAAGVHSADGYSTDAPSRAARPAAQVPAHLPPQSAAHPAAPFPARSGCDPLDDLLAVADATEAELAAATEPAEQASTTNPSRGSSGLDFARVLHAVSNTTEREVSSTANDFANATADTVAVGPAGTAVAPADTAAASPIAAASSVPQLAGAAAAGGTLPQLAGRAARAKLDLLIQLREVGVPVSINPRGEAHTVYQAMEEILAELPATPSLPRSPGDLLAVVGPLTTALRTANTVADQLRIPHAEIWIAGLTGHPAAALFDLRPEVGALRSIDNARDAFRLRGELRSADGPSIIVVATDSFEADPNDRWPAEILQAVHPTAAWLIVDATGKSEDDNARLAKLGRIDAIAVHSAQLSSSPATVWDLGLPVAMLDGRPASTFAWAGLLFAALKPTARHQATG